MKLNILYISMNEFRLRVLDCEECFLKKIAGANHLLLILFINPRLKENQRYHFVKIVCLSIVSNIIYTNQTAFINLMNSKIILYDRFGPHQNLKSSKSINFLYKSNKIKSWTESRLPQISLDYDKLIKSSYLCETETKYIQNIDKVNNPRQLFVEQNKNELIQKDSESMKKDSNEQFEFLFTKNKAKIGNENIKKNYYLNNQNSVPEKQVKVNIQSLRYKMLLLDEQIRYLRVNIRRHVKKHNEERFI